jgi:hypothetical protein
MKRTGSLALALVATFTLAAATATAQHDASHPWRDKRLGGPS